MTDNDTRGLLKSMTVTGSANLISMAVSILRLKVLALILGPAGVGLLGIYSNILSTASTAAGLGMVSSGVRQIASVKGELDALSRVRVVLFWGLLVQGILAMALVWWFRDSLAHVLLDDEARATEVGLIALAVLLTLLASSQTALLRGMRRIGDLARVTILGSIAGTLAGLMAIWVAGDSGLIWFVLVQPLTAFIVAGYFTKKLPRLTSISLSAGEVWQVWKAMAGLGAMFMVAGLATTTTLLIVRGMITNELGIVGAGLFAASWGITMQYVGVLLTAMGADYYPRLTEVIHDRSAANGLMNDQAQLGLAIGGPILILLVGLAPWVVSAFYSSAFLPAAEMLQWQTVGNVFKLASWPLSFALVAGAHSRLYLAVEVSWNLIFLGLVWVGLPLFGLQIAGTAFLFAYVMYLITLNIIVRRLQHFRWQSHSLWLIGVHVLLSLAVLALARYAAVPAAAASIVLAAVTGLVGGRLILAKIGPSGRLLTGLAKAYTLIGWPLDTRR